MYISESSPFTPPTQTDRHTKLNLILFFFFGVLSRQLGAQCCPFAVIHAGMTLISSSSSLRSPAISIGSESQCEYICQGNEELPNFLQYFLNLPQTPTNKCNDKCCFSISVQTRSAKIIS